MTWRYIKPLVTDIESYELKQDYEFPIEFKQLVTKYNGGRPSKCVFLVNTQQRVMKSLLSFNLKDKDNIWNCGSEIGDRYIAFAIDNYGNTICFDRDDNSIVFRNHETEQVEYITDNFTEFLKILKYGVVVKTVFV